MKNSYTIKCKQNDIDLLLTELNKDKYLKETIPHTIIAASIDQCRINLYNSGKLLIQGKKAKEWIQFTLEPNILKRVEIDYDDFFDPMSIEPHMGIDESGKGDFFGPLVIASAYTDKNTVDLFRELGVQDSKNIKSDQKINKLAKEIRSILKNNYNEIIIGPESYNKNYSRIRNVNKLLAWGHAKAIENLLEIVPSCPRALSDKFGPEKRIKSVLMDKGKKIILEQKIKAESDPAVAAASILARDCFIRYLLKMGKKYQIEIPRGASKYVRTVAEKLVEDYGPNILSKTVKCHFKTTDQVLESAGFNRNDL